MQKAFDFLKALAKNRVFLAALAAAVGAAYGEPARALVCGVLGC